MCQEVGVDERRIDGVETAEYDEIPSSLAGAAQFVEESLRCANRFVA
jgi:hypothetical protein